MSDLPEPLVPTEVDLHDFPFTPVFRARLFGSSFHARCTDAEWRAGVTLWLRSWDQVPAGSLPDDEIDLCRLAELGRDLKSWRKVKTGAMRGWVKCSDMRLYHRVVAEGVLEAWARRSSAKRRGAQGGAAKWGSAAREAANKQTRSQRLSEARARGTHTHEEWEALLLVCGTACLRCHQDGELVKDHVKPIYQGGSDSIENIQPLCRSCNASKGPECIDHRPVDWKKRLEQCLDQLEKKPEQRLEECLPTPSKGQGQGQGREVKGTEKGKPSPKGAKPADPDKDEIWKTGRALLNGSCGKDEAGSFLGKLCREYGTVLLLQAIRDCDATRPAEPKAWLVARCQERRGAAGNKQVALEERNRQAAAEAIREFNHA